ncbi:transposase (plasmid) [Rhodovastum atsumiense]|nr:transposase [Rhodovastum atsumiense]
MLDAALESADASPTDRPSGRKQRIEVITRGERRRIWTVDQKREIAAESLEPGASPITVARKYGISTGQLYTWRQQLLRNAVGAAATPSPGFVRVDVVPMQVRREEAAPPPPEPDTPAASVAPPAPPPPSQPDGRIEIMLSHGVSVRVDAKVDGAALRRVLAALERR